MADQTQHEQEHEQASPAVRKRVRGSFDRQGLLTHLEAVGTVLKPGRTLTVCQLGLYGVQKDGGRKRVAHGRQSLVRANRAAE